MGSSVTEPVSTAQLTGLVERHRFLRSVCLFHTASEESVMYPELRRLSPDHVDALVAAEQCSQVRRVRHEHSNLNFIDQDKRHLSKMNDVDDVDDNDDDDDGWT